MQVQITNIAAKDLRKMPVKDALAVVSKLEAYAKKGEGDVKKLQGREGFRLRHGVWRALFVVEGDMIVLRVLHRNKIYKR